MPRSAGDKTLGDVPWRDVDDIGTEQREQFPGRTAAGGRNRPGRIGKVDPLRRADVRQASRLTPRRNAFQMRLAEIAWPPGDVRVLPGEVHNMLAGAAAGLE